MTHRKERDLEEEKNRPDLTMTNTCGLSSVLRGDHQKIIAYSFFQKQNGRGEEERNYYEGIFLNMKQLQVLYDPRWTVRLYHNLEPQTELFQDLRNRVAASSDGFVQSHLDLCYVQDIPMLGSVSSINPRIWRFLPLVDQQVKMLDRVERYGDVVAQPQLACPHAGAVDRDVAADIA